MIPSLFAVLLLVAAGAAQAQKMLPATVSQALAAAKIPPASVAVLVQEVGVHHEILRVNPDVPMNPASVMKLVTTYAALEQLGPAYRWKTEVYASGALRDPGHSTASRTPPRIISSTMTRACSVDGLGPGAFWAGRFIPQA